MTAQTTSTVWRLHVQVTAGFELVARTCSVGPRPVSVSREQKPRAEQFRTTCVCRLLCSEVGTIQIKQWANPTRRGYLRSSLNRTRSPGARSYFQKPQPSTVYFVAGIAVHSASDPIRTALACSFEYAYARSQDTTSAGPQGATVICLELLPRSSTNL